MRTIPKFTDYYVLTESVIDKLQLILKRIDQAVGLSTLKDIINIYLEDKNVDLVKWLQSKNIEIDVNLKYLVRTFALVAAHIPVLWLHTALYDLLDNEAKQKATSSATTQSSPR